MCSFNINNGTMLAEYEVTIFKRKTLMAFGTHRIRSVSREIH